MDHSFTQLNEQLDRLAIRSDQTRLLVLTTQIQANDEPDLLNIEYSQKLPALKPIIPCSSHLCA